MIRVSGRTRVLSVVLAAALAGFGTTAAPPAHASPGGRASAHQRPILTRAQATTALDRAQTLFHGTRAQARAIQRQTDATMVLRDLKVAYPSLSGAQKAQADRILARPSTVSDGQGSPVYTGPVQEECNANFLCVHYDLSTDDPTNGVDPTNTNGNSYPDYVDQVLATLEHVRATYAAAGYQAPLDDSASSDNGGDLRTDIYLAELGNQGLYGYCTSDDPNLDNTSAFISYASAYCVLDNDYSHSEFPVHTPLENLEVTAAHEFFHAVQFSYDFYEDTWIMEATATWAEDELYDGINDNMQYLKLGPNPISNPWVPIDINGDQGTPYAGHWYGTWIFFRFLTERVVTTKVGGLPVLVRDIWRRLNANDIEAPGAPDEFSIQGVRNALASHGVKFTTAISRFDVAARHPTKFFSEAAANHYPSAPIIDSARVGPGHLSATASVKLLHLSFGVLRLAPKPRMGKAWRLRLHFDLPPTSRGAAAAIWINKPNGGSSWRLIPLSSQGDATVRIGFSTATVSNVEITLINASARFGSYCWHAGQSPTRYYSCYSLHSVDDGTVAKVQATAYKS